MAQQCLNNSLLVLRSSSDQYDERLAPRKFFRIAEVEFFMNDVKDHPDSFQYDDAELAEHSKWHFGRWGEKFING